MAIIKSTTLPTGEAGNYWKMTEVNSHAERGSVATLQLYKSKELRQADAQPMALSYQFIFTPAEIEAFEVDESLPTDWRDVWYHVHYVAIKSAAVSANSKPAEERTPNETRAINLLGGTDDI